MKIAVCDDEKIFREEIMEHLYSFFGKIKIHRGYIVNLSKVKKSRGNEVIMSDDTVLPISRSAENAFKKRLFDYIKDQAR